MRPEPLLGAGMPLLGSPRSRRCDCPSILSLLALRWLGHVALVVRRRKNVPLALRDAMRMMRGKLTSQIDGSANVRRNTPANAQVRARCSWERVLRNLWRCRWDRVLSAKRTAKRRQAADPCRRSFAKSAPKLLPPRPNSASSMLHCRSVDLSLCQSRLHFIIGVYRPGQ